MKLNPSKCAFRVAYEKFLGFVVTSWEIEANLKKIQSLLGMLPPRTRKEVQHLPGKVVALSRFMVRAMEKHLPFFKILKWANDFQWLANYQLAFDQL